MTYLIREYSTRDGEGGYTVGIHTGPVEDAVAYAENHAIGAGIDVVNVERQQIKPYLRGTVATLYGYRGEMVDVVQMPPVSGREIVYGRTPALHAVICEKCDGPCRYFAFEDHRLPKGV